MERLTERMNDELNGVWVKDHDYIAAVRRLAAYEDTGLEPEEILSGKELAEIACALNELTAYKATGLTPEAYKRYAEAIGKLDIAHMHELLQAEKDGRLVVLPPNNPLTIEELREMQGKPVWISVLDIGYGYWAIVRELRDGKGLEGVFLSTSDYPDDYGAFMLYNKTWVAYRYKPDEALLLQKMAGAEL